MVFLKVINLITKYHLRLSKLSSHLDTSKDCKKKECGRFKRSRSNISSAETQPIRVGSCRDHLLRDYLDSHRVATARDLCSRPSLSRFKSTRNFRLDTANLCCGGILADRRFYQARHFYLQAGRIASWRKDWAGLVAAACGFKRLDGVVGPYSISSSMLIHPTMAAELMQSRRGIATVATAFATIGSDQASKAVLARIQPYWPDETNDPGDAQLLEACWGTGAKSRVIKQTDRLKIDRVPVGQRFGIEVIDSVCWRAISAITATEYVLTPVLLKLSRSQDTGRV